MTIDEIIQKKYNLDERLKEALSNMELKDTVKKIRKQIKANQALCPHHSDVYNQEPVNGICPYCGKKI